MSLAVSEVDDSMAAHSHAPAAAVRVVSPVCAARIPSPIDATGCGDEGDGSPPPPREPSSATLKRSLLEQTVESTLAHVLDDDVQTSLVAVLRLAVPTALTQMLRYSCNLITTVYCGQVLDSKHFGAIATGLTFTTLTALSIGSGVASAMDTLSTQAYGREEGFNNPRDESDDAARSSSSSPPRNLSAAGSVEIRSPTSALLASRQGMYLRQSLVVTYAVYLPIAMMYLLCGPVIRFLVDADMADLVVLFLQLSWLIVVPVLASNNLIKFSQAQCEPMIGFYASIWGAATLLPILLVVHPRGVVGVVGCLAANRWLTFAAVHHLTFRNEKLSRAWGCGWRDSYASGELSLSELRRFFIVGLPSLVANVADTWSFEIMSVVAASIGDVSAATWSVLMTIYGVLFAGFVGLASAASTTVGNSIGGGSARAALLHAKTVLVLTAIVGTVLAACLYFWGYHAFQWIQSNAEVSASGRALLHLGAFTFVLDVVFYVMQGIYRGIGQQKLCAVTVLVGMWGVAIPATMLLAKVLDVGVLGILGGLTLGLCVSAPLQLALLFYYVDWEACATDAERRHVGGTTTCEASDSRLDLVVEPTATTPCDGDTEGEMGVR